MYYLSLKTMRIKINIKYNLSIVITFILCFIVFHPGRHAKYYFYINDDQILSEIIPNYSKLSESNLKICDYKQVLNKSNKIFDLNELFINNYEHVQQGGEHTPNDCIPKYSTAVIVCYRNRPQQLEIFLKYMHVFLREQKIHYRIFVADQNNTEPFNRALMLNYGSLVAMDYSFPCLILHDVDLLPLNGANFYVCSNLPRHLSTSIDVLRFNLPYHEIVGGVLAIQSEQFKSINGMSNLYFGWGGEDDDLYRRMAAKKLYPIRFSSWISRYTMLKHKQETPSPKRFEVLADSWKYNSSDGLNSLTKKYEIKLTALYTHVIVN